jgi:hypothetical protein
MSAVQTATTRARATSAGTSSDSGTSAASRSTAAGPAVTQPAADTQPQADVGEEVKGDSTGERNSRDRWERVADLREHFLEAECEENDAGDHRQMKVRIASRASAARAGPEAAASRLSATIETQSK